MGKMMENFKNTNLKGIKKLRFLFRKFGFKKSANWQTYDHTQDKNQ